MVIRPAQTQTLAPVDPPGRELDARRPTRVRTVRGRRSGCGLSGHATRPGGRRASRQAGSASRGGKQDQLAGWRGSGRRAEDQLAGWQREQNRSRRAAARAVRSSGRPAGRRRGCGPQRVAAAAATCCSRSVTRTERELELRWCRPVRAGLKMPNTCGRKLAMTSDSETGGSRVLQQRESRDENLSYQREQDAGIANATISNSTKGRDKGAAVRRQRRENAGSAIHVRRQHV